jgi:hypothetical protein
MKTEELQLAGGQAEVDPFFRQILSGGRARPGFECLSPVFVKLRAVQQCRGWVQSYEACYVEDIRIAAALIHYSVVVDP